MRAVDCLKQAEECLRLIKSAESETEARVLRDLANSWKRVAGQIDRYRSLARDTSETRKGFGQNAAKNPSHAPR
jgi:multidrug resistance efflux pump